MRPSTFGYQGTGGGAIVRTVWDATPLIKATQAALKESARLVAEEARSLADWKPNKDAIRYIVRTPTFAVVTSNRFLGHLEELDTKAHDIYPGFQADSMASALSTPYGPKSHVFVSGIAAHPYMKPAAAAFPSIYRRVAPGFIASGGIRSLSSLGLF